jgi:Predicted amidohydrolase
LALFAKRRKKARGLFACRNFFGRNYFCQTEDHKNFDLAEEVPGRSTAALGEIARETGTAIIASLFERRGAGVYHNTAAILDTDGKLLGKYRKMHIPDDPLYHEKFYFTPGDLGFQSWNTQHGKIGVCVCWDQWYPEAARLTALRGAEIIFYPTAIGWHPSEKKEFGAAQHSAWETIQRSHASRMVAMSRLQIALAMKRPPVVMALSFGGKASYAGRTAKSPPKLQLTRRRL